MLYILLVLVLLSVRPLQCMDVIVEGVEGASTTRNAATDFANLSKVKAQKISDIHLIKPNERMDMRTSFSQSEKRFIFLDNDGTVKPFDTTNGKSLKKTLDRTLQRLARDPRNHIWIITAKDVSGLEETYGHIEGLHLAGQEGSEIAETSQHLVNLPDAGPIEELRDLASKLASENGITIFKTSNHKYDSTYYIQIDKEKLRSEAQDAETGSQVSKEAKEAETATSISEEDKKAAMDEKLLQTMNQVMENTKKEFQALIDKNDKFKDFKFLSANSVNEDGTYRLAFKNMKYAHKGTLVQALLEKYAANQKPFVLTMGDMQMDENMHKLAKSMDQYSILVKNKKVNPDWATYASHSLENHKKAIQLLEYLGMKTFKEHYTAASVKIREILAFMSDFFKELPKNIKSIPQSLHEYLFQRPTPSFNQEFHVQNPAL